MKQLTVLLCILSVVSLSGMKEARELDHLKKAICGGMNVNEHDSDNKESLLLTFARKVSGNNVCGVRYSLCKREDVEEVFDLMIEHGFDVSYKNKNGYTALHWSVWKNPQLWLVEKLLNNGADVNAQTVFQCTPLHFTGTYAFNRDYTSTVNAAKMLLENGARVNVQDARGMTVLHHVVQQSASLDGQIGIQQIRMILLLLFHGIDYKLKDKQGSEARDYANNKQVKRMLEDDESVVAALVNSEFAQ